MLPLINCVEGENLTVFVINNVQKPKVLTNVYDYIHYSPLTKRKSNQMLFSTLMTFSTLMILIFTI